MSRKTVCLNMIVKDEAHVIRRCLESVRPLIDSWLVVDTGSSDGTQEIVRQVLGDLPGELIERPWRDFGHNRNEALELAKSRADYLFFIDADDVVEVAPGFARERLQADAYDIEIHYGELYYRRVALVSTAPPWSWRGVLHEYLECDRPFRRDSLAGVTMHIVGGGARSQLEETEKFARDAEILRKALAAEPGNTRYAFYLAQSFRDAQQLEAALAAYDRRATMGGFAEEVFCSLLQGARLARRLGRPSPEVIDRYLRAHESRPARAEPLGDLAMYLREQGNRWPLAHLFARRAIELPQPPDVLFVEPEWYRWRSLDEFAVAAYWVGDARASLDACEKLLAAPQLPETHRARIEANRDFARAALAGGSAAASH